MFLYAHNKFNDIVIDINIVAFIIIQVTFLIRRLNYTNRNLISFLDSIRYDDSSVLIHEEFYNQDFLRLSKRLQKVNKQIIKLKEQNIQKDLYFRTVTEHASTGLLSFNETGNIKLCNKAFKTLLHIDTIKNISQLNSIIDNFENTLINLKSSEHQLLKITIKLFNYSYMLPNLSRMMRNLN